MANPAQGTFTSLRIVPYSAPDTVGTDGSLIGAIAPAFMADASQFTSKDLTGSPQAREVVRGKQKVSGDSTLTANRSSILPVALGHFGGHRVRGSAGFYTHEYWYSTMTQQAIELSQSDKNLYEQWLGCLFGTLTLPFASEDIMQPKFGIIGAQQVRPLASTSLVSGTLTNRTGKPPIHHLRSYLKIAGAKVASATKLDINSNRTASAFPQMDETEYMAGVITEVATCNGTGTFNFNDGSIINGALDPENIQSLEAFANQGNFYGFQVEMPNVKLQLPKTSTQGTGLRSVSCGFDASGPLGGGDVAAQLRSKFFVTPTDLGGLTLIFTVPGAGAQTITFASGDNTPALVATKINATATLLTASVERMYGETGGSVVLKTIAKGSGTSITIGGGTANTALGFTDLTATPGLDGQTIILRVFTDVAA
jgi:hypothetical protein